MQTRRADDEDGKGRILHQAEAFRPRTSAGRPSCLSFGEVLRRLKEYSPSNRDEGPYLKGHGSHRDGFPVGWRRFPTKKGGPGELVGFSRKEAAPNDEAGGNPSDRTEGPDGRKLLLRIVHVLETD